MLEESAQDEWVPSVCYMCYSHCGIQVCRANGVVAEIKGDPNSPQTQGKVCAKGKAGLMGLYDPYRLKTPLKRTNLEKGIGVDPNRAFRSAGLQAWQLTLGEMASSC